MRFLKISFLLSFLLLFTPIAHADQTGSLLPASDGSYTQWTPSAGSTHYAMVDESTCNGTTDYNKETTLNSRDSYGLNISAIPNGSTITDINITPCASKNSNGGANSTLNVFYRLNGADSADSGSYSLSGTTPVNLSTTSFTGLSTIKSASTTFEIGAVLSAGNKGARLSRIAAQITYSPLIAPSSLNAATVSASQLDLTWVDNSSNENGFNVERSPNGLSSWIPIGTPSADITTFSDTGLTANTTYYYRVSTFNTGGISGYSNIASAKTLPNPPTVTTNSALSITSSSASLSATINPNGASTTRYYRYDTVNLACDQLASTTTSDVIGSGTSDISPNYKTISSLSSLMTYYYCSVASNSGGVTYGNVLSFTTL